MIPDAKLRRGLCGAGGGRQGRSHNDPASGEMGDEILARDSWENEDGHAELAQHRKKRSGTLAVTKPQGIKEHACCA
jgi:hypothetical protein